MKRIIYIGDSSSGSTSFHRANALERLGNIVTIIDPYMAMGFQLLNPLISFLHFRTGYRLLQKKIKTLITSNVTPLAIKSDLLWINSGELIGRAAVTILQQHNIPTILYNNDDPFGGRDGRRFDSLRDALSFYSLCVVCRDQNITEYLDHGVKQVLRVWMSYDEMAHAPYPDPKEIPSYFLSEVAFIGTWMRHEKRDQFLWELIERGVPLSIWGAWWQKSPMWDKLKHYYRGGHLVDREYVAAIQGAKLCIGMLSKGNRDLHTSRTMEVPYVGGNLCAERTPEHLMLYKEDEEAVFWSDSTECATKCLELLADPKRREAIRLAGMKRVRVNKVGNEDICRQILDSIFP